MKNLFKNIKLILPIIVSLQFLHPSGGDIIRSLAMPGWGELHMNESSRAKIFFTSEALILATHFLGSSFNKSYIDQYTGFAELHADIDMDDRDYDFIIDMSNYDSMADHDTDVGSYHGENFSNYQFISIIRNSFRVPHNSKYR